MVFNNQQIIQISQLIVSQTIKVLFKETREHQIELKKSTTTLPAHTPPVRRHTARRTIMSLIFPIALVGLRFFGQTSTQFMIEWQRNNR